MLIWCVLNVSACVLKYVRSSTVDWRSNKPGIAQTWSYFQLKTWSSLKTSRVQDCSLFFPLEVLALYLFFFLSVVLVISVLFSKGKKN